MSSFNVYICGVGGQGVGLLAAALAQAADRAGLKVISCDTHGLAQRGGVVSSHVRMGEDALTPLVPEGGADLVLALERLEALRGAAQYLKKGGKVFYYDTAYQPVSVRRAEAAYPSVEDVEKAVKELGGTAAPVRAAVRDPRMQNAALLGRLAAEGAVPGLAAGVIEEILREIAPAASLEENLAIFRAAAKP
jgi:indolepyruvate ferredoxin oxidoreductase beta subunit